MANKKSQSTLRQIDRQTEAAKGKWTMFTHFGGAHFACEWLWGIAVLVYWLQWNNVNLTGLNVTERGVPNQTILLFILFRGSSLYRSEEKFFKKYISERYTWQILKARKRIPHWWVFGIIFCLYFLQEQMFLNMMVTKSPYLGVTM